jgi:hypothetical protein
VLFFPGGLKALLRRHPIARTPTPEHRGVAVAQDA